MKSAARSLSGKSLRVGSLLAATLLVAVAAIGATDPNQNRGFAADKVYHVGEIDSINPFNGNLIVSIPIGPAYPVRSGFSYQLTLTYNSTIWDYEFRDHQNYPGDDNFKRLSVPEVHSNAGLGWILSLGQLFRPKPPSLISPGHGWMYIGSDGAEHEFSASPQAEYSFDSSYLRMKHVPGGHNVEFPDGTIHKFNDELRPRLTEIRDRFGNGITITPSQADPNIWEITDTAAPGRMHRIHFAQLHNFGAPNFDRLVTMVELAGPEGRTLRYEFLYRDGEPEQPGWQPTMIDRGGHGDQLVGYGDVPVPLLERVRLPDGTEYVAEYHTVRYQDPTAAPESGALKQLAVPTGAMLEWTYGQYELSRIECDPEHFWSSWYSGVETRKVTIPGQAPATWTYRRTITRKFDPPKLISTFCPRDTYQVPYPPDEFQSTLRDPNGVETTHFYAIYPQGAQPANAQFNRASEYGRPFSRRMMRGTLALSSEVLAGCPGTMCPAVGTPDREQYVIRRTFVQYEDDGATGENGEIQINPRKLAERVEFPQDTSCNSTVCWTEETNSDFDGHGHYRGKLLTTNFPGQASRFHKTNYTPSFGIDDPWILGMYDHTSVAANATAAPESRTDYCFDRSTGFLRWQRSRRAAAGTLRDLVTAFVDANADGNADQETFYGGDRLAGEQLDPLPAATSTCDTAMPDFGPVRYRLAHTYSNGVLATSQYAGSPFLSLNQTIDPSGVVRFSRDPALLETEFRYGDVAGRLTEMRPPGGVPWTQYSYTRRSGATPASVAVKTWPATSSGSGGTPITDSRYYYDGMGQLVQKKTLMPDGWSTTRTTYDANGRTIAASMPQYEPTGDFNASFAPTNETTFTYDALGRVLDTRTPDAKIAKRRYAGHGTRSISTEVEVGIGENGAPVPVTTYETFDGLGRLTAVKEWIAAGNTPETTYAYDLDDHLTTVTAGAQTRSFAYDEAGLLSSETHPENGTTTYSYDAKGHVLTKKVGAEHLQLAYDFAERLRSVRDAARNRDLQVFRYDSATGPQNQAMSGPGRLLEQIRYNDYTNGGRFTVADYFTYDAAGRLSQKETVVTDPAGAATRFTLPFTYDAATSLPSHQNYPSCTGCGTASLPARAPKLTFDAGMLRAVEGFTAAGGITYLPHGGVHKVVHASGPTDFYDPDPNGMSRPAEIRVMNAQECALILTPPTDANITSGDTVTFTVVLKDANATVKWYKGLRGDVSQQPVFTGTSLVLTNVTADAHYWARVTSVDGGCVSDTNTVRITVCKPPQIISPAADATDAQLYFANIGTPVEMDVLATATQIRYDWTLVDHQTGVRTPLGTCQNLPGCSWTPASEQKDKKYSVEVLVRGSCGSALTRVVKVIKVVEMTCNADVAASFPAEIPMIEDGGTIALSVLMNERHDPYVFRWYQDGNLVWTEDETAGAAQETWGRSEFHISVGSGATISVVITRHCAWNGIPTQSASVTRKTYIWNANNCPVPKVTMNQLSTVLGTESTNRTFIAQCDWGSVRHEWYVGDRGNTRVPAVVDPAKPDRFTAGAEPGTYWVRTISPCGTFTDSPTLVVSSATCQSPVRFAQQPQSATVHAGVAHTLTYDATSKPLPNYTQWFEGATNSNPISNSPSLVVAPLRTTSYWVQVSNGCHQGGSALATLSVRSCSDITYSVGPKDREIRTNQQLTLTATATARNGRTLFYKWYEGASGDTSKPVTNGETPSISVSPSKSTRYWVRIDFHDPALCAVDSEEINVYVCATPALKQPLGNALSTVPGIQHWLMADSEGDRLRYQWYQVSGSSAIALTPGVRTLRVAPTQTTQYYVEIANDCREGNDEVFRSNTMTVSVCPQDISVTGSPLEVMNGTTASLSVTASGGSLRYKWYRGSSGDTTNPINAGAEPTDPATITTPPITADTNFWVRVYSGECFRNSNTITVKKCVKPIAQWMTGIAQVRANQAQIIDLTVDPTANVMITYYKGTPGNVASSEVVGGPTVNRGISVSPSTTTTYWARAKLEGSVCYGDTAGFTVNVCIPTITTQPQAAFFNPTAASNVTLTVAATAAQSYQWYIGESGVTTNPIAGATGTSLTVAPANDTKYWVRVTGSCSPAADSTAALVTVCKPPAISSASSSQVVTSGTSVPLTVNATGTSLTYQWYRGLTGNTANPIAGATASTYNATQSTTTNYWVKVSGTCGSASSGTIKLSVAPVITTQPASVWITSGTAATFSVAATGTELTYLWYSGTTPLNGYAASFTTPALTATTTYWVRVWSGTASVDSVVATANVCQPKTVSVSQPASVSGSQVTLSVGNPESGESYEWFEWTSATTTNLIGTSSSVLVYPAKTTDYTLRMRRGTSCFADRKITVTVCTPVITSHPVGTMVNPGQSTRVSVGANGTPALTYQWFIGASGTTTSPVSGATNSYLDVAPSADTNYWVRVTSGAGASCTANSNTATVQVCKPPSITAYPQSITVPANSNATVSVGTTGTNLSYQWYRGTAGVTTAPVGTNSPSLTILATGTADYWVRITGRCGAVDSTAAKISVPPVINTQPASTFVTRGTSATFSVAASGAQLTYLWYSGSTPLNGYASTFTTPALTATTTYWVRVWSGNAWVDSAVATATVCDGRSISVTQHGTSSGSRVDLAVVAPSGEETYDWYANAPGVAANRVGGGIAVSVNPLQTTTYYLRTSRSTCYADAAMTVTVTFPTFTTQPQDARINAGGSATLTAAATGTPPLTYQWYSGTPSSPTAISGATSTSLTVTPSATATYFVQARSNGNPTNSRVATVSVCRPPAITSQPPSAILHSTDTVTLTVGATGDNLTYRWYAGSTGNTSTPVGENSPSLTTQPGTTRSYWVRIIGECGTVDSATALLSVRPVITSQPADQQVCAGASATLTISTQNAADSYTWYRVDGATNTFIGSGTSVSVPVNGPITVWCDVVSGNAHTASRNVSLTTRPGPAAWISKTWLGNMAYRLQAHVPEEELPSAQYVWYRGPVGNVAGSQYHTEGNAFTIWNADPPATYWVRVTNTQTGCWTDRGVTVP